LKRIHRDYDKVTGSSGVTMQCSQLVVVDSPLIATSARKHDIHDDKIIHAMPVRPKYLR
jgi:hypothetical protein